MICLKNCEELIRQLKKANEDLAKENAIVYKLLRENSRTFEEDMCRWKVEREDLLKRINDLESTIETANSVHYEILAEKRDEVKKLPIRPKKQSMKQN
jgi:phage shock protein A